MPVDETCQIDASALSLRQASCRQVFARAQTGGRQRLHGERALEAVTGHDACGDEILERSEVVLQRGGMAQVDQVAVELVALLRQRTPLPEHFAFARCSQPAEDAQQTGLAGAIGAQNPQQFATRQHQIDTAEETP